ncbi:MULTISPECIES: hypothetical protein [unclassified Brachybacterium]|uniref:hypothetical protein n=1 Tax=unclassified Brachybacterium TaxID=2623841 RepID=UPI00360CA988
MRLIHEPLSLMREHRRAYRLLNVMAYGLLVLGMAIGMLFPEVTASQRTGLQASGDADLVTSLLSSPWLFALTILAVNIGRIIVATIVVPSLVIPFSGIAVFAYFAVTTGMTLAPVDTATRISLIPHVPTMVIEFQAYVLMMLGAYVLGRAWLRPATVGQQSHRRGYLGGLRRMAWLALAALALLVAGAVYEALSLVYLLPVVFGLLAP